MFDDPRIQPLMGMAYKTFRKHKYGLEEPYENDKVVVKRGVLLGRDNEEGIIKPGDKGGAFVDGGADLEADAIVRKEYELGGVPYPEHLRVIEEQMKSSCT